MRSIKWILFGLTLILFSGVAIAIEELFIGGRGPFQELGIICSVAGLIISTIGFLMKCNK